MDGRFGAHGLKSLQKRYRCAISSGAREIRIGECHVGEKGASMNAATLALLVPLVGIQAPVASNDSTQKVEIIRQRCDALEASVRQVKGKTDINSESLSGLEKQYAATAKAFEDWRGAAASATDKEWDASRKRIDDVSRTAAQAMTRLTRDARALIDGQRGPINGGASAQFARELSDAARAVSRVDDQARLDLTTKLAWRPWSEITR
jgi:hypothetical protein